MKNTLWVKHNFLTLAQIFLMVGVEWMRLVKIGQPRTKIASLKGGYHGDTFGSMSLGYVPDFFAPYKTKLFDVMQLPSPDTYRTAGLGIEGNLHACLDKIEKSISKNSDSMAALVMESGAQMAAGARIYPPNQYVQRDVSKICSRHNVLLD